MARVAKERAKDAPARNRKAPSSAKVPAPPRSLAIAENGIETSRDFARLMSALMSDLIAGRVPSGVGNAACNAGGKLLKVVELQLKYGPDSGGAGRDLVLAPNNATAALGAPK